MKLNRRWLPLFFGVCLLLWLAFGAQLLDRLSGTPENDLPVVAVTDAPSTGGALLYTQGIYGIFKLENGEATSFWQPPSGGDVRGLALTPDGSQLVISYTPPDAEFAGLYLLDVASPDVPEPLLVAEGESFGSPHFAPDSAWLYFSRYNQPRTFDPLDEQAGLTMRVERLSLETGEREIVVEDAEQLTFSPDGAQATYLRHHPDAQRHSLWIADGDGSNARMLVSETRFDGLQNPRFHPANGTIIFGASGRLQAQSGIAQAHGAPWRLWEIAPDDSTTLDEVLLLRFDGPWTVISPAGELYVMDAEQILRVEDVRLVHLAETRTEGEMIWLSIDIPLD